MALIGIGIEPKLTEIRITASNTPLKMNNASADGSVRKPFTGRLTERRSIVVFSLAIFICQPVVPKLLQCNPPATLC